MRKLNGMYGTGIEYIRYQAHALSTNVPLIFSRLIQLDKRTTDRQQPVDVVVEEEIIGNTSDIKC